VAFTSRELNTLHLQLSLPLVLEDEEEAGRELRTKAASDFACSSNTEPELGSTKPNWYDRGMLSSSQLEASRVNTVDNSTPSTGLTSNTPGVGGELVDMRMEARVSAPGLPQVRVKDWEVPADRDWEGRIRLVIALYSTVLVLVIAVGDRDSFLRSNCGLEVDHEQ
jgi:hypothetical protein